MTLTRSEVAHMGAVIADEVNALKRYVDKIENTVSTRRLPPCRRDRAFDLNGACMSAAKIRGNQQHGDYYRS